jgi:hypothetical protein
MVHMDSPLHACLAQDHRLLAREQEFRAQTGANAAAHATAAGSMTGKAPQEKG